eukprot:805654-Rhodomonas_salina.1
MRHESSLSSALSHHSSAISHHSSVVTQQSSLHASTTSPPAPPPSHRLLGRGVTVAAASQNRERD